MSKQTCVRWFYFLALFASAVCGDEGREAQFPQVPLIRGIAVGNAVYLRGLVKVEANEPAEVLSGVFDVASGRWTAGMQFEDYPNDLLLHAPDRDVSIWRWHLSLGKSLLSAGECRALPPGRAFVIESRRLTSHLFAQVLVPESWDRIRRYGTRTVGKFDSSFREREDPRDEVVDVDWGPPDSPSSSEVTGGEKGVVWWNEFSAVHWPLHVSRQADFARQGLRRGNNLNPLQPGDDPVYFDLIPLAENENGLVVIRDGTVGFWKGVARPIEDMTDRHVRRATRWRLVHTSLAPFDAPFLVATNASTTYLITEHAIARAMSGSRQSGDVRWTIGWSSNVDKVIGVIEDFSDMNCAYVIGSKVILRLSDSITVMRDPQSLSVESRDKTAIARGDGFAQAIREFNTRLCQKRVQ